MTRSEAIRLFGTRQSDLADALGISRSAIAQWSEDLTQERVDRVVGAALRLGRLSAADAAALSGDKDRQAAA